MTKATLDRITFENSVPITSLKSLSQGYILNCRCEGKSPKTVGTYDEILKRFFWFLAREGFSDSPTQITAQHIRGFLWYLSSESTRWEGNSTSSKRPAGNSTVNHYYRVLNTFFKWLHQEGFVQDNPVSHLRTPKITQKAIKALTENEIEALLSECPPKTKLGARNRAILTVLLDSGMRVSELASLTVTLPAASCGASWTCQLGIRLGLLSSPQQAAGYPARRPMTDVDMTSGAIHIRQGKGGKQRVVRIGTTAQKTLWKYLTLFRNGDDNGLFLTNEGKALTAEATKLTVRRLGSKAGVANVHVHRLRHTFAISFLRAGGDVFSLRYLMGHSTLQMTQRYLQSLNAGDAAIAHKKFSPLDNMGKLV